MNKEDNRKSIIGYSNIKFSKPFKCRQIIGAEEFLGYQVDYMGEAFLVNIEKFYDKKLSRINWKKDEALNSDGPLGHSWGYRKENKLIVFMERINIKRGNLNKADNYKLIIFCNDNIF